MLSHESAALHHGWPVLLVPQECHVTVPANRRLQAPRTTGAVVHRAKLETDDVSGIATSQSRTVVDCLRNLPMDRALAVADSALRAGRSPGWLATLARDAQGRGAAQVRAVASEATELAANPFESGLRAIGLGVGGLSLRPQVPIHADGGEFLGRPDLVDTELRIIAEADSFEWHGGRVDLVKDARRYNDFVVEGWMVLRFTWDDVTFAPDRVRGTLERAVIRRSKGVRSRGSRAKSAPSYVQLRSAANHLDSPAQKPNVR